MFAIPIGLTLLLHLSLFVYDVVTGFDPFLLGDRGYIRLGALEDYLAASWTDVLQTMVHSEVGPGEYLFVAPFYGRFGEGGVILFQLALLLLSVLCIVDLVRRTVDWTAAAWLAGVTYVLLPNNIVFPHQLVTEAVATPLVVFAVYFTHRAMTRRGPAAAVWAALFLGLAILIRPGLAVIVPVLAILPLLLRRSLAGRAKAGLIAIAVLSLLPLAIWTATFSTVAGSVGVTSGVANLQWNLRSKVFLVHRDNGLTMPDELAGYRVYADLYQNSDGIGVTRFLRLAADHPVLFIKHAVVDALIVMGRGNASKIMVDYLRIDGRTEIKGWRQRVAREGLSGQIAWMLKNPAAATAFTAEVIASVITIVLMAGVTAAILFTLARPERMTAALGPSAYWLLVINAAVLLGVIAGAQLVDQAQARLRNPAEASLVLTIALVLPALLGGWRTRSRHAGPPFGGAISTRSPAEGEP